MIRHVSTFLVVLTICLGVLSNTRGESTAALEITLLEPMPPITTSDVIRLRVETMELVSPSGDYTAYSSFAINGFDIDWHIFSERGGAGVPVPVPMVHVNELGPLPIGNYELAVTWTHPGSDLPFDVPQSGIGTASFSVVPEPSACSMLVVSLVGIVFLARLK